MMRLKMNFRFVVVLIFIVFPQQSKCSELDDEIDDTLLTPTEELKAELRTSFVTSSFYDWIKNVNFINYGSSGYFLTFPEKTTSSILVNGTNSNIFPLSYTLAGAALVAYVSAYLISFLPIGGSIGRYGNDEYEDDLGYGLQRDTEITFDELDDYDYQYPDSIDFSAYTSASEPKLSTRKVNRGSINRKGEARSIAEKKNKLIERPGILGDLSNKFWSFFPSPVKRAGGSLTQSYGIKGFFQRYEDYWKRRRSGGLRRSSNVEENTFRNKRRKDVTYQSQDPLINPYYSHSANENLYNDAPQPNSYSNGPSWPGQTNGDQYEDEVADITDVYSDNYGVEGRKGDKPVEYVYSQK